MRENGKSVGETKESSGGMRREEREGKYCDGRGLIEWNMKTYSELVEFRLYLLRVRATPLYFNLIYFVRSCFI